ncbi:MAG: lytic transglycosylase [Deltaproteobacteria bacterium RIFOXYD12_FULL_53_23]|nr:MAG: lytic transglycosylase [Deltaproteobacteria bacterium RIFOXYD12_FULL_53_23]
MLSWIISPCLSSADEREPQPRAADLVEDGQSIDLASLRYQEIFQELSGKHGFAQEELDRLFAGVSIRKRVLELMDTQWEAKPYFEYSPRFITPQMIEQGRRLLGEHREVLDRIEKELGVEREIVVAIWGVESKFGAHKGAFSMFQTLNTMFDAYPRRSKFYREQLIEYLLLCRENGVDPLAITGSYGGAFGQTQFIPSSFRLYAVDFDGDGRRDVWESVPDILASIANYLHRFGWTFKSPIYQELGKKLKGDKLEKAYAQGRKGFVPRAEVKKIQGLALPPSPENRELTIVGLELRDGGLRYVAGYPNFQAVTKWNNSNRYAMVIAELAEKLRE